MIDYFNYMSVAENDFIRCFKFISQDNYTTLSKRYKKRFTHYKAVFPNGDIREMRTHRHPIRVCRELQQILNSPIKETIVQKKDSFVKMERLWKVDTIIIPSLVQVIFHNGKRVTLHAVYYS